MFSFFPILLSVQHVVPPNGQSRDLDVALTYLSAVSDPGEGEGGGGMRAGIVAVAVVVRHAWLIAAICGKLLCTARVALLRYSVRGSCLCPRLGAPREVDLEGWASGEK